MSKIALSGNASGTGTFTFASPNSNTDRTLDLPDASGVIDRLNRAGNVLQVVSATYATQTSTSSSSFTDTGLTASITPTSSSSKILIIVQQNGMSKSAGNSQSAVSVRLLKSSTNLGDFSVYTTYTNSLLSNNASAGFTYLDSPATTSSTTYKTQFANPANAGTAYVQDSSAVSSITLLEIAA